MPGTIPHRSVSLLGSASIYMVANGLNAAIPFLLLPILTRALTPTDYGIVGMFAMVLALASTLTGLSVHGAIGVRYFEQDRINLARYVSTCLAILGVSTALVLAAVWLTRGPLERVTDVPARWLVIAVLVSGALFVVQIRLVLWQVSGHALKYGAAQVAQSALNVGLSLLFVLVLSWSWDGRTAGQSIAVAAVAGIALVSLSAGGWARAGVSREYARDALRFGVPLIPHAVGGFLVGMADRFMITNMLDVSQTGIYLVGVQIGMVLAFLTDSFNRAFAPWLFGALRDGGPQKRYEIVRLTYAYFGIVLLLALALGFFAPSILGVLVGEQFRKASEVVLPLAIGQAFVGMYYMVTNYLFYTSRTGLLAGLTLSCGIVNVMLSYHLIREHGAFGAAQAFMVSQALMFLGTWVLAQKVHPMPWRRALVWKGGAP